MSLTDWDGSLDESAPTTPVLEADEDDAEEVDEPDEVESAGTDDSDADEGDDDGEDLAPAALIDNKFKTTEDLLAAYHQLQREFHEKNQPQPEVEEADEDDDPFGLWGTALGNDEAQQLAQRMIDRPTEAQAIFEYVEANQHQFGPNGSEIADQMFALWHAQSPRAAMRWHNERQWADHEAAIAERQAPLEEHHRHQMAGLAVHRAMAELPRFDEFKDQIMANIASPDMQTFLTKNPEYTSDPNKMFALLETAMDRFIGIEFRNNHRLAANGEPAPETTAKKPRTQQRSSVAPPETDEVLGMFPPGFLRAES